MENRNGNSIWPGIKIPDMVSIVKIVGAAVLIVGLIVTVLSYMSAPAKFVIQPVALYEGKEIVLDSEPLVILEGKSFEIDLGKSSVPAPPVNYLYDNNGDGVAETPFTNGNSAVFTMWRSDPLPSACKAVQGGELCGAKITGVDSAGNTAEFVFYSTTLYK